MKPTTSQVLMETIEETKERFSQEVGKNAQDEKKLFINWYIKNHVGPFTVLINDLSEFYLHISENRILQYLNEKE